MTQLDPQWIVGFVDGEGCFYVGVIKNKEMSSGYQIQPEFTVVQGDIDYQVLHSLKNYFGCGSVTVNRKDKTSTRLQYRVKNLKDLIEKILPFFEKHQLKTKRKVEFQRFRTICLKLQKKEHLNKEGFEEIVELAKKLRVRKPEDLI